MARFRSARGASAVEYGLLVALIAIIIIVAVSTLGSKLNKVFGEDRSATTTSSFAEAMQDAHPALITACEADKDFIIARNGHYYQRVDATRVDEGTGATSKDLSGIKLGRLYLLQTNSDDNQVIHLQRAESGLSPSLC